MEIKTKARRWGNSIALILPKVVVDSNKIKENQELTVEIKQRPLAGKMFGKFSQLNKKSTQKIKSEMKKGWS
ncbi:MAG: hypothetical protein ABIH59_01225 [archaeon]